LKVSRNLLAPITRKVELLQGRVESKELFSELKEITILHNEEEYKLRITGNSKLILTK